MTDNIVRLLNEPKFYRSDDQVTPICPCIPLDVPKPELSLFERVHFSSGGSAIVTGIEYISAIVNAVGYEGTEDIGWHYTLSYEDGDVCDRWHEEDLLSKLKGKDWLVNSLEESQSLPLAS